MYRSDRVRIIGPLASYLRAIEEFLLVHGYSRSSINNRLGWVAQLSRWMLSHSVNVSNLTEAHLLSFVRSRRRVAPTFSRGSLECVVQALVAIGGIPAPQPGPVPPPSRIDRMLEPFEAYLAHERGLKRGPSQYMCVARRFLVDLFGSQAPCLQSVTADDLSRFVLSESRRFSTGTVKITVTALRSYFRFLYASGVIPHDLTGAIPAIAGWRQQGLPKGIEPDLLSRLLSTPDRCTLQGRRDYAILLLLARLGLRRHEVASLTLEDINWQRGELLIHGKGEKQERIPLPRDVGAALVAHLRKRESSCHSRSVFLRVRTPFRTLTPTAISDIVLKYSLEAGGPPIRAHRLRHTVATQILRKGGSLDEVAQVLRHSSHDTTAIYAKVDLAALRAVTQPWPTKRRKMS